MKKKLILTLLTLLSFYPNCQAQEATQRLVVWQKSGEKVYYQLADQPETTFENGQLVIKTTKTTVYYQLANIVRYTYEGVNTAIDLMPNERSVSISNEGDAVTFQNLPVGSKVMLFASNGVLLEMLSAQGGQPLTVSIGHRPAGVYIVKYGSETIKLLKR
jgi:hypothetical protein